MRVRGRQVLILTCAAALLGATAACGGAGTDAKRPGTAGTAPSHARFDAEISLPDGRRVGMYYAAGRGLVEQHRGTGSATWSKPHLLHRTTSDPCQSLRLKAFGTTVAAIANWGVYCADGEPPTESLAAVGTGNLSEWDTKVTPDFDGWEAVRASEEKGELSFTNGSVESVTRLRWHRTEGFSDVEEIPR
ncbi:hypothetical protein ABZT48_28000 [Streptomyces avermitilis]|uniref:hypothetical protein n=1 Tax=Streptomyces avermitilis TaxID=33903 RepID=UPI0033BECAD4